MASDVLTIGYGNREVDEVARLLQAHEVRYLVDVRSHPYSRYRPDFNRKSFSAFLESNGIRYLFMGDTLGGRPDDPACYDEDGHVDYRCCSERSAFRSSVARLIEGARAGHLVALLCSEARPEQCHRTKLIGEALIDAGTNVAHIDETGRLVDHGDVLKRLQTPQLSFIVDDPRLQRSRKTYAQS